MTDMEVLIVRWIKRAFGSILFLGYLPGAPGTVGSLVVVAALWFGRKWAEPFFQPAAHLQYWTAAIVLIAVSILLSNDAQNVFGRTDPKQIIIDECAGQFLTFFMIPFGWRTIVLGFFLFRFFDIIKPFPVYKMEELDDGLGITMDDVAAGLYANISLHAILWLFHAVRSLL